ncbi:class I SAM-dependent methyltransferase [Candidatus Dojkabacteria bacterium]|jgi:SAM-dependent methyltransferase|nr:class I SAM-dependent methyltransferase [Candidatus Dojkabacteria bacterium]
MYSPTREKIFETMKHYADKLKLRDSKVLEVGIGGDPEYQEGKKGGNYGYFGNGNDYKTLDCCSKYNPDYVQDICKTDLPDESFDLIILSQTLEHIYTPIEAFKECNRLLKKDGHLIVDCPWNYPQHDTEETGDFYRYTPMFFERTGEENGFKIIEENVSTYLVSCLMQKL